VRTLGLHRSGLSALGRSAAVATLVVAAACGGGGGDDDANEDSSSDTTAAPSGETSATTGGATEAAPADANTSWVAQAQVPEVAVFETPESPEPIHRLPNPNENGAPLVFLVDGGEPTGEWVPVHLPVRPNGSKGFVRAADVTLATHTYRIQVALADHTLTLLNAGEVELTAPIGVGTADTPTPGGIYYVKELLQPPDPNGAYGPYAYGLSGFSNELTSFAGGEGVIGIHGTNEPDAIGTDVSSGCIRVENEVITQLAEMLPLGTPVEILA
jgi:lipoprotein-anchoring transpeptidase ErfK/SrfK